MYFIVYTFTPSDSAASGFSPHARSRRPNAVRHSRNQDSGKSRISRIVNGVSPVVMPRSTPARSEIENQWCFSILAKKLSAPGSFSAWKRGTGGDCAGATARARR